MDITELLAFGVKNSASDLHLSAGLPPIIRVHGDVRRINLPPMEHQDVHAMVYDIMNDMQRKTYEETLECDFSFEIPNLARFRVNAFNQNRGAGAVFRTIPSKVLTLEDLAAPKIFKNIAEYPRGVVLVTGPTGSGKSTTIAAMLDHRNTNATGHILTVEDPVEYLFKHKKSIVNQREIGLDTKDWASALKNAMRQAPDCILIGEIRDRDTMQAAIAYAQTGHLCVATLHANNSYHALNRIINFFEPENRPALFLDLAVALRAIASQRLVKRPDGVRVPACEIMINTRHIADLIEKGEVQEIKEAMEQSLVPGSQTFEQDLLRLVKNNIITLDEALENAESPTNLMWLYNNDDKEMQGNGQRKAQDAAQTDIALKPLDDSGTGFKEFKFNFK